MSRGSSRAHLVFLAGCYLAGLLAVALPAAIVAGDLSVGLQAGMWVGGVPAGILAVHYIYGGFPFRRQHPIGNSHPWGGDGG